MRKPKVFVGSSKEAQGIAEVFCSILAADAIMVPWWDTDDFRTNYATLESLFTMLDKYDFGIFVLTPDDSIIVRGEKQMTARDNVLFEYGLFLGRLGRDRVFPFMVKTDAGSPRTMSDLAGITIDRVNYSDDEDTLKSEIRPHISRIRDSLRQGQRRKLGDDVIKSYGNYPLEKRFYMTLKNDILLGKRDFLGDDRFVIVARKEDSSVNYDTDTVIAVGTPRILPSLLDDDFRLFVSLDSLLPYLKDGDYVQGYLYLIPKSADLSQCKTIAEIEDKGGRYETRRSHQWEFKG